MPEYKEDSIQTTVSKDIDRDCCIRLGRDWRLHQVVLYKKFLGNNFDKKIRNCILADTHKEVNEFSGKTGVAKGYAGFSVPAGISGL